MLLCLNWFKGHRSTSEWVYAINMEKGFGTGSIHTLVKMTKVGISTASGSRGKLGKKCPVLRER